jgi:hypothetical protein
VCSVLTPQAHVRFALRRDGEPDLRIRVIKGVQKAEGLWRHLKHSQHAIPEEVRSDDERLNMYAQTLVWRMQCIGCPYWETLRMCRAFRHLPLEQKRLVFQYGLKKPRTKHVCWDKPQVQYCQWSWKGQAARDPEEEASEDEAQDNTEQPLPE